MATGPGPRYMVLYEGEGLATLASPACLARLNNPSPWTTRMMPHYRGMVRGLCAVVGSVGLRQGGAAALIRFSVEAPQTDALNRWLLSEELPALAQRPGLASAHLLHGAQAAAMTREQNIRGADRVVDSALIVTGHDNDAVGACAAELCGAGGLASRGAVDPGWASYPYSHSLARTEVGA